MPYKPTEFNLLSKEDGAILFEAISHTYDLIDNVIDVIEKENEMVGAHQKLYLVGDVIETLQDSTDLMATDYMDWYEQGQVYDAERVKERENASLKVYNAVAAFVKRCSLIPSTNPKDIPLEEAHAGDDIYDSPILAKVGTGKGELQQGGVWESLHEQMCRLPELRDLIQAVRNCTIHIWRIAHCFISRGLSFVRNIHAMVPLRRAAEIRMERANQELQTHVQRFSSAVKQLDTTSMGRHYILGR